MRHVNGVIVRAEGGEGIFGGGVRGGGGVQGESEATYVACDVSENQLSGGILSYCKGDRNGRTQRATTSRGSKEV